MSTIEAATQSHTVRSLASPGWRQQRCAKSHAYQLHRQTARVTRIIEAVGSRCMQRKQCVDDLKACLQAVRG